MISLSALLTPLAVVLAIILVTIGNTVAAPQRSTFGNEDINKYLANPKYVEQQLDCVLGRSGCDSVGRNLKAALPLALRENCRACSSQQVANARKLGAYIAERYPQEWSQIRARYGAGK